MIVSYPSVTTARPQTTITSVKMWLMVNWLPDQKSSMPNRTQSTRWPVTDRRQRIL
nr:MAG TPA: hypothetical protein [Caudoviricetes sp.]